MHESRRRRHSPLASVFAVFLAGSVAFPAASVAQDVPPSVRPRGEPPVADPFPAIRGADTARRWASGAVWYHVIISRFCNEDPTNDPQVERDPPIENVLRGPGDLKGLRAQLPYLSTLTVNTLLLSDAFALRDDVRPPALDLLSVRPELLSRPAADGTPSEPAAQVFLALLEDARSLGFRIVLDLPLAQASLPDDGAEAIDHLIRACARWTRSRDGGRGVDGWLVRSPQRLPREGWTKWCAAMREIHPTVLLAADAPGEGNAWIADGLFDVLANHRASLLVRGYLSGPDRKATCGRMKTELATMFADGNRGDPVFSGLPTGRRLMDELSWPAARNTGSIGGPRPDADLNEAVARWRLAIAVQFVLPGAPVLLGGDEYGLSSHPKFGAVPPMLWRNTTSGHALPAGDVDARIAWVKWWIERRDMHRPLRDGAFEMVLCDDENGLLALSRIRPGEKVVLVTNASGKPADVILPAARPGQMVGVLSPRFDRPAPDAANESSRPADRNAMRLVGTRQFADGGGHVRLRLPPRSLALVLVND